MIISPGFYLVSWLFDSGLSPLCICENVADAKAVVADKLNVKPEWTHSGESAIAWTTLNIIHEGHVLQGVLIQQVPLYKVEHA